MGEGKNREKERRSVNSEICLGFFMVMVTQWPKGEGKSSWEKVEPS